MTPLEPIEEKDLDLEGKFKGTGSPELSAGEKVLPKSEKEIPREASSAEKDQAYGRILSKVKQAAPSVVSQDEIAKDAQNVFQKTDAESQIQHLVDLAVQKNVIYAVKVARHLEDNYVLDQFHDRLLADDLREALKKKGLIKEE